MGRLTTIGFEMNSATAGVEFDAIVGAACSISSTTKRTGSYAGRVNNPSSGTPSSFKSTLNGSSAIDYYIRFYLYIATLPNATTTIFRIHGTLTGNADVTLGTGGVLSGPGGGSTTLSTGVWYRVEMHTKSSSTTVGETLVDGVSLGATGLTITQPESIQFGANLASETCTTLDIFFDDIAVNDTSGAVQNAYPGAGGVVHLFANAAGDNADWVIDGSSPAATNWQSIDEVTPNDGVDYVKRTTTTIKVDDYNLGSPATAGIGVSDTINVVHVGVRGGATSNTDNAGRRVLLRLKSASGGSVVKSAGAGVPATSGGTTGLVTLNVNAAWVTHKSGTSLIYPQFAAYVDPTTGTAFTRDGTNSLANMQVGMENESSATTAVFVTAVWAIVDFAAPAGVAGNSGFFDFFNL